jgi:hypothetical protein
MFHHIEEIESVDARVRIDIYGEKTIREVLGDVAWLSYRLGEAHFCNDLKKPKPDLVWYPEVASKQLNYVENQHLLVLYGGWTPGELQRIILCLLVKCLEENDHYVFHSSIIRHNQMNIMFMSGEANHGKTMSLIESVRRGAEIISTEGTIVDICGKVLAGTKNVFLNTHPKGAERSDIPPAMEGWRKFFDALPQFKIYEGLVENIDIVILPDIDGNFDTFITELSRFEREYQTFCCLTSSYYQYGVVVSPGIPMPILDDAILRTKRAQFTTDFANRRPYYLIRGRTPNIILNEVEKLIRK